MEAVGREAFEAFVAASGDRLLHTAVLLTGDYGHGEDVTQAALERVAAHWHRLEGSPEAYARRCIVNLSRDRWRQRRSRVVEVELSVNATARRDPDDAVAAIELRTALMAALRTLPPRQRAAVTLRYFLDLDEAATAAALGISVGAVKSSTSRGLAALRRNAPHLHESPTKEHS